MLATGLAVSKDGITFKIETHVSSPKGRIAVGVSGGLRDFGEEGYSAQLRIKTESRGIVSKDKIYGMLRLASEQIGFKPAIMPFASESGIIVCMWDKFPSNIDENQLLELFANAVQDSELEYSYPKPVSVDPQHTDEVSDNKDNIEYTGSIDSTSINTSVNPDICWSCANHYTDPYTPYCKNEYHHKAYLHVDVPTEQKSELFDALLTARAGYDKEKYSWIWKQYAEAFRYLLENGFVEETKTKKRFINDLFPKSKTILKLTEKGTKALEHPELFDQEQKLR